MITLPREVREDRQTEQPTDLLQAGEVIVACLEKIGVEYVFGIPGGAIEPLYNAMARSAQRGGLRPVLARHESGAAFMADGYARETGKIGVCVATSGPGATNLITGVACAYDNGVPLLVITGQPALPSHGRRSFQESGCTGINVIGMFLHCTKYSSLVSHPDQIETKLVNALVRAYQMQRPVHLSIPVDVLRSPTRHCALSYDLPSLLRKPSLVDDLTVQTLFEEIKCVHHIVFIVGGGCVEAIEVIMELVGLTGALFVSAPDGKGLIDSKNAAYRGVFGFGGHQSANALLLTHPELIIAIGTSMGEWNCSAWSETLFNNRLIHIDASEENLARTPMARLHVQGRILTVCERLINLLRAAPKRALPRVTLDVGGKPQRAAQPRFALDAYRSDAVPIKPQRLMRELSVRCPPSTRFLADPGNSMAWALHYLEIHDRRIVQASTAIGHSMERRRSDSGWLKVAMDFCPMGWAIGAAVGVARGSPNRPVVCITGDGSYLMNGQEITVAASERLCVLYVILNDGALGMVKHGQRLTGAEPIAFELPKVDFCLMAEAMGIPGHIIRAPSDLDALDFYAIFRRHGPTLLDVRIDGEEIPPMNLRVETLTTA